MRRMVDKAEYVSPTDLAAAVYTKTQADNLFATKSMIVSVFNYKGVKDTYADLPASGNVTGDVWSVTALSGEFFAWNGTVWVDLGNNNDPVVLTSAEYAALSPVVATTFYFIKE